MCVVTVNYLFNLSWTKYQACKHILKCLKPSLAISLGPRGGPWEGGRGSHMYFHDFKLIKLVSV